MEQFSRTERLIGKDGVSRLIKAKVAVFGLGGVGSYAVEALARAGVGTLMLIDGDVVAESNINRQLIALHSTVGKSKAEVEMERISDINPNCTVIAKNLFYLPENANEVDFSGYDYVVDAVDTVTAKLEIILRAKEQNVPVISAMGAGNRTDALSFKVADVSKTSGCPLARAMRRELKKRGIEGVKVVYSDVEAQPAPCADERVPASISYVPSVMGLIIAGEVIKTLALE